MLHLVEPESPNPFRTARYWRDRAMLMKLLGFYRLAADCHRLAALMLDPGNLAAERS